MAEHGFQGVGRLAFDPPGELHAAVAGAPGVILLEFGLPVLALLGLAVRGAAAGLVGLGIGAFVVVLGVLVDARAATATVMFVLLTVMVAGVGLAAWGRCAARLATVATIMGALAAGTAILAGAALAIPPLVMPGNVMTFVVDGGGWFAYTPLSVASGSAAGGRAGLALAIVGVALVAAVVLLVLAVLRGDRAGALVAAAVFAVPPVSLSFEIGFGETQC